MERSSTPVLGTALVDLVELLRRRLPLSDEDVADATGADVGTVKAWLERRALPGGEQAVRLIELIAARSSGSTCPPSQRRSDAG